MLAPLSAELAAKIPAILMKKIGYLAKLIAASIILGCFCLQTVSLWTLLVPMTLFFFGQAVLASNFPSLAMADNPDKANSSAVFLFMNLAVAMLCTFLFGINPNKSILNLPVAYLIALAAMLVIACVSFVIFKKQKINAAKS